MKYLQKKNEESAPWIIFPLKYSYQVIFYFSWNLCKIYNIYICSCFCGYCIIETRATRTHSRLLYVVYTLYSPISKYMLNFCKYILKCIDHIYFKMHFKRFMARILTRVLVCRDCCRKFFRGLGDIHVDAGGTTLY